MESFQFPRYDMVIFMYVRTVYRPRHCRLDPESCFVLVRPILVRSFPLCRGSDDPLCRAFILAHVSPFF